MLLKLSQVFALLTLVSMCSGPGPVHAQEAKKPAQSVRAVKARSVARAEPKPAPGPARRAGKAQSVKAAPEPQPQPPSTAAAARAGKIQAAGGTQQPPAPGVITQPEPAPAAKAQPASRAGKPVSVPAGKVDKRAQAAKSAGPSCRLEETEAPRGGRLDVAGERFGKAPVVRIGGKVARILERTTERVSVQVARHSDGGPVTLQAGSTKATCGTLTIIGKNR